MKPLSVQRAALLSAALLLPAAAYAYNPFTDVDESDWDYYDVLTADSSEELISRIEDYFASGKGKRKCSRKD